MAESPARAIEPAEVNPGLLDLLAEARRRGIRPANELTVEEARGQLHVPGRPLADPGGTVGVDVQAHAHGRSIRGRIYEPADGPIATVVFFHGGGWVIGSLDMVDALCRGLAEDARSTVFSVQYSLAPELPFPEGLRDCLAATRWIAEAHPERPLIVMGESAGANLATVVCRHARDAGGPAIQLQVLAYPIVDLAMDTGSYADRGGGPGTLTAAAMRWYVAHYLPDGCDPGDPDVSPLRADLTGMPAALVIVAEHDPLRDDGLGYVDALAAAGVPVHTDHHIDMTHGFLAYWPQLAAAQRAFNGIVEAISRLGDGERDPEHGGSDAC